VRLLSCSKAGYQIGFGKANRPFGAIFCCLSYGRYPSH
jgi:hypothetical protein